MKCSVWFLLCAALTGSASAQTQIVVNPGFESGLVYPWLISGAGANVVSDPRYAFSGNAYLQMGIMNGVLQTVYQTVTFPTNTIGVSFYYYRDIFSPIATGSIDATLNVFIAQTNGTTLYTLDSVDNTMGGLNRGSGAYSAVVFNPTTYAGQTNLAPLAGQTVNLVFVAITSPTMISSTTFYIDNVNIVYGTTADIPNNDNFDNSITVPGGVASINLNATNSYATKQPGEPNIAGNSGGRSVWWSYTPTRPGVVTLDTTGSSFTTLLGVYTGPTVSNLTAVGSSSGKNQSNGRAKVTFGVLAGVQYMISVDGYNGASGPLTCSLSYQIDTTPPKVSISNPAANAKVTNSMLTVTGTASDNAAVAAVEFQLVNSAGTTPFQPAFGTTNWSALVTGLAPGTNTVRVRAVDTSTNYSTIQSRTYNYTVVSPFTLNITGNGTVSPSLSGQLLVVGSSYTLTEKPGSGAVFNGWSRDGSLFSPATKLTFTMQSNLVLNADFVPNPFGPIAGVYQGLFYDTNSLSVANSGLLNGTLKSSGSFSAKISLAGQTLSASGLFLGDGSWSNSIARKNLPPLSLQLQLDLAGDTLSGTVSDGTWTVPLVAKRNVYSKTNLAPQAGKYTLLIPGLEEPETQPGGDSFETVSIDTSGNVTLGGLLADNTKLSQKTILSAESQFPVYASLYSGQGVLLGWLTVADVVTNDIYGTLGWIKQPVSNSKLYPAGFVFTNGIAVAGSKFAYTKGVPLLGYTNGVVEMSNGNLEDFIYPIFIGATGKVTSTNKLSVTISTSAGSFKGTVPNPATGKGISVNGVILQKQGYGSGFFLGTNESGRIFLSQPPP
ncbi:MAG: Ig-like domain-containing protein [Verrucomicrobiota bacterium]